MKRTRFHLCRPTLLGILSILHVPAIVFAQSNVENRADGQVQASSAKLQQKFGLKPGELFIVVDPSDQRLYVVENQTILKSYDVATSKYGIGNEYGSGKTPPGTHRIKEKFGDGARPGAIFKERRNTGKIAQIFKDKTDIPEDLVTTRILWLAGQERGINKGGRIDTQARYIYIHGTPEEGLIGAPASRGCIRMRNADVVELFELVPEGTLVEILAASE